MSPLLATLTDPEREVTALVADGMSNTEIARQLTLSPLTVKTHVNHAMTKLDARTARNSSCSLTRLAWPARHSPGRTLRSHRATGTLGS